MGGFGSGRGESGERKRALNAAMGVDIREIQRDYALEPGMVFFKILDVPTWSRRVTVEILDDAILLQIGSGFKEYVEIARTPCTFGGSRPWFLCPRCGVRVAMLYAPDGDFECRRCCDLVYPSQREKQCDRATSKANKIRERLGWPQGILNPRGFKPKGMRWSTYQKLVLQHDMWALRSLQELNALMGWDKRPLSRQGAIPTDI